MSEYPFKGALKRGFSCKGKLGHPAEQCQFGKTSELLAPPTTQKHSSSFIIVRGGERDRFVPSPPSLKLRRASPLIPYHREGTAEPNCVNFLIPPFIRPMTVHPSTTGSLKGGWQNKKRGASRSAPTQIITNMLLAQIAPELFAAGGMA
jgi:hypothetical protein